MDEQRIDGRPSLFLAWILMILAAVGTLLVVVATVAYWDAFDTLGKVVGVGAILFAVGALGALTLAFFTSIFLPALRSARRRVEP